MLNVMSRPSYLLLYFITISSTCSPAPTSCVSSLCAESMVTQVEEIKFCSATAVAGIRKGVECILQFIIIRGFIAALALLVVFIAGGFRPYKK